MSGPSPKVGDVLITTEAFYNTFGFHSAFTTEEYKVPYFGSELKFLVEDVVGLRMIFCQSDIDKYFVNIS